MLFIDMEGEKTLFPNSVLLFVFANIYFIDNNESTFNIKP